MDDTENGDNTGAKAPTTRRALMLGAVAASAVVSVRPALAKAAGSILNCEIPVTGPHGTGMNIDAYGKLLPRDTPGSYVNYIRRLQSGQSGFTCYASLQMQR